jgi:hypothetical protein
MYVLMVGNTVDITQNNKVAEGKSARVLDQLLMILVWRHMKLYIFKLLRISRETWKLIR